MGKLTIAVLVVALVACITAVAQAAERPTVTVPADGWALGPNYEIHGSLPSRALVVVLTDAVLVDTGEVLRTVPGIRHYTNYDGTFEFRCASPRVSIGDRTRELKYRVRCFTLDAYGNRSPETVINCTSAR